MRGAREATGGGLDGRTSYSRTRVGYTAQKRASSAASFCATASASGMKFVRSTCARTRPLNRNAACPCGRVCAAQARPSLGAGTLLAWWLDWVRWASLAEF